MQAAVAGVFTQRAQQALAVLAAAVLAAQLRVEMVLQEQLT